MLGPGTAVDTKKMLPNPFVKWFGLSDLRMEEAQSQQGRLQGGCD